MSRHKAAAITFINEKLPTTGSLVISKQVTGDLNPEDADTVFHFVLTLDDNTLTTADAEEYGVAFRKGSDVAEAVNAAFDELKADGTMQKLADKYSLTLAE